MSKGQIRVVVLILILIAMEVALQPGLQSFFKGVAASVNRNKKAGNV